MKRLALLLAAASVSSVIPAAPPRWTPPEPVAPETAATCYQLDSSMAGTDTVLWCGWCEARQPGPGPCCLRMSRHNGGVWLPPESLGVRDSLYAPEPAIAIDKQSVPWIVWDEVVRYPDSAYCAYARRDGDTWTHPAMIAKDTSAWGYDPGLAARPEYGVVAVWVKATHAYEACLFVAHGTADSWTFRLTSA